MSDYTKVTIKKQVAEQGKIQAAAQNRSLANYVEYLIINDVSALIEKKLKEQNQ